MVYSTLAQVATDSGNGCGSERAEPPRDSKTLGVFDITATQAGTTSRTSSARRNHRIDSCTDGR